MLVLSISLTFFAPCAYAQYVEAGKAKAAYDLIADFKKPLDERMLAYSRLEKASAADQVREYGGDAAYHFGLLHLNRIARSATCAYTQADRPKQVDYKKVFEYWIKAAEAGHEQAALDLGDLVFEGKGCEKDVNGAAECWLIAAQKGNRKAIERLSKNLAGIEKDAIRDSALLVLSAAGEAGAKLQLARTYTAKKEFAAARAVLEPLADNADAKKVLTECEAAETAERKALEEKQEFARKLAEEQARATRKGAQRTAEQAVPVPVRTQRETPVQPELQDTPPVRGGEVEPSAEQSADPVAGSVIPSRNAGSPDAVPAATHAGVVQAILLAWGVISIIGLIAGYRGGIVVFANWMDVVLTGIAIIFIFMSWAGRSNEPDADGTPPWVGPLGVTVLMVLLLALRSWFSNRTVLKTLLAVPTKITTIGVLLFLLALAIGSLFAFRDAKTVSKRREHATNAIAGAAGAGAVMYLINKLIAQNRPKQIVAEPEFVEV